MGSETPSVRIVPPTYWGGVPIEGYLGFPPGLEGELKLKQVTGLCLVPVGVLYWRRSSLCKL